jgi:hypothetical protein
VPISSKRATLGSCQLSVGGDGSGQELQELQDSGVAEGKARLGDRIWQWQFSVGAECIQVRVSQFRSPENTGANLDLDSGGA